MVRLFLSLCLVCLVEGCYTSTVRVESNPAGANVYYDFQPKGVTPVEFNVDYLGTHKITLDHPDYGQREEMVDLGAPPYLWFPFDFITTILPIPVKDRHSFTYDLTKQPTADTEAEKNESEGTQENQLP